MYKGNIKVPGKTIRIILSGLILNKITPSPESKCVNHVTYLQNYITSYESLSSTFKYMYKFKFYKMKKTIFIALLMIFSLGASTAFAGKSDSKSIAPAATENKLSTEELSKMKNRVEEIRKMDKSEMTVTEKRELRKESKGIKENVRKNGEVIYISGGTILLIIIILLLV